MRAYVLNCVVLTTAVWVFAATPALGANTEFQDFFFAACVNPTGGLAARCGETTNAQGNLSGDSESSLNPSQSLSNNDAAMALALRNTETKQPLKEDLNN